MENQRSIVAIQFSYAQALCLEEMLHIRITEGSLFYGTPIEEFKLDLTGIRTEAKQAVARLHL